MNDTKRCSTGLVSITSAFDPNLIATDQIEYELALSGASR